MISATATWSTSPRNWLADKHVDPEELGRELKVMQDWEVLAE